MQTYFFVDLDDTLFQTAAKCADEPLVAPVAYDRDDQPSSFMTRRQQRLWQWLALGAVIPTTGRNREAFARVALPFTSFKILDFGGVVLLPSGDLDDRWDAAVRPQAETTGPELLDILAHIEDFNQRRSLGVRARVIADFQMPLYLVVKHPAADVSALRAVLESVVWPREDVRWTTHFNGNNLSLLPNFLGKERAVAHVIDSYLDRDHSLFVGCADSDSDAPYLRLCDYAIVPRDAQLLQGFPGARSSPTK